MSIIEEIAAERRRQVEVKGWSPEHDDTHKDQSLALAAALYASPETLFRMDVRERLVRWYEPWPWMEWVSTGDDERGSGASTGYWYKDGDKRARHSRRENLITAAAFIVAEIERLDRASAGSNAMIAARLPSDQGGAE